MTVPTDISPLRSFVRAFAELLEKSPEEPTILADGALLLQTLVAADGWLPELFCTPDPDRYRQYLLHCDSAERFSVVSFVWGPGQSTPIHDHRTWGLVGLLRGSERVERFRRETTGALTSEGSRTLTPGHVDAFSPATNDIHRVANELADAPSISIHVYGANIGTVERSIFSLEGVATPFVSRYANGVLPNLWQPEGRP